MTRRPPRSTLFPSTTLFRSLDSLAAGQTVTDSFTVTTADGTSQVVTVTINGTDDQTVIGGVATATVTEANSVLSRSEEHTTALQARSDVVCRLALEKRKERHRAVAGGCGGHERLRQLHFFFNDTATTEIYTLSLHDALPIYGDRQLHGHDGRWHEPSGDGDDQRDR